MRQKIKALLVVEVLFCVLCTGCKIEDKDEVGATDAEDSGAVIESLQDKYGTTYEIFVRSYYDSDGDGIGDLSGVTEKLDYLNDGDPATSTDLAVDGIWLMPIMPSTTYHKYDVTDYYDIDEEYGTLEDFDALVAGAHERGMKIYLDLVINHTSSQHPWFQVAKDYLLGLPEDATEEDVDFEACPYVAYYHFTKNPPSGSYEKLEDSGWYYECPFWSEMPDLDLENEAVRAEIADITAFWIDRGVDGFRLDAIKEYVSSDTEKNIEILGWFMDMVRAQKEDIYVVGEAWTDATIYTRYYESGIDSCFDFDFADKEGYIAKLAKGDRKAQSYVTKSIELMNLIQEANPDGVNAPFFVNHDMGRAAGYFAGDEKENQMKIAWAMNFLETGNAFLYYGEELAMKGSGEDENKRLPMQWSTDSNGTGMTTAPEGADDVEMPFGSLEEQVEDSNSIYQYVRALLQLRSRYPMIARGEMASVPELSDESVAVFWKKVPEEIPSGMSEEILEAEDLLICMNLSTEEKEVNLSQMTSGADGTSVEFEMVADLLVEGDVEKEAALNGDSLSLKPYEIVFLTLVPQS